jgi:hypothetical protein
MMLSDECRVLFVGALSMHCDLLWRLLEDRTRVL